MKFVYIVMEEGDDGKQNILVVCSSMKKAQEQMERFLWRSSPMHIEAHVVIGKPDETD